VSRGDDNEHSSREIRSAIPSLRTKAVGIAHSANSGDHGISRGRSECSVCWSRSKRDMKKKQANGGKNSKSYMPVLMFGTGNCDHRTLDDRPTSNAKQVKAARAGAVRLVPRYCISRPNIIPFTSITARLRGVFAKR
jgi:hypothetical protein